MKILSIDIGILNLGYVWCDVEFPEHFEGSRYKCLKANEQYMFNNSVYVVDCGRINITHMRHSAVERCKCTLQHSRCVPDYLDHFIQEHHEMFETSDVILLEQQPPCGLMNVQDLLFTRFRNKIAIISPSSVHCYFNMDKEYLIRKQQSELFANPYLQSFDTFILNERKHDISDALLMVLYYYKCVVDTTICNYCFKKCNGSFEQFRFINT
jgi:hypothetical protein